MKLRICIFSGLPIGYCHILRHLLRSGTLSHQC